MIKHSRITRRHLVQGGLMLPAVGGAAAVVQENARSGDDWQLTNVRVPKDGVRSKLIEGYCSHQSIEAGETLRIMVSEDPAGQFGIEIFRMGYYGGAGARKVISLGPYAGKPQP